MKKANLATPLQPPLAANEVRMSVAEVRPQKTIRERARRADLRKALGVLKQAGKGRAPVPGDELVKP